MGIFNFLKNNSNSKTFRNYIINGISISVEIEKSETHPGWVKSSIFRSRLKNEFMEINPEQVTTEDNFFDVVEEILNHLNGKEFGIDSQCEALISFCESEINRFGKLYYADIEGYLDAVMHIIISISKAKKMKPLNELEGSTLRDAFKTLIYKRYSEFIKTE